MIVEKPPFDPVSAVAALEDFSRPEKFTLSQNYPNPFNPVTTINYSLSEPQIVQLTIFNVLGQKIRTLVDKRMPIGNYTISWDGTADTGDMVSTGIYIVKMKAGSFVQTKKMTLLK